MGAKYRRESHGQSPDVLPVALRECLDAPVTGPISLPQARHRRCSRWFALSVLSVQFVVFVKQCHYSCDTSLHSNHYVTCRRIVSELKTTISRAKTNRAVSCPAMSPMPSFLSITPRRASLA